MTANQPRQRTLWEKENRYAYDYQDHKHDWRPNWNAIYQDVRLRCETCGATELPKLNAWFVSTYLALVAGALLTIATKNLAIVLVAFAYSQFSLRRHERHEKRWFEEHIQSVDS